MSAEVVPDDWTTVDSWWHTFAQTRPTVRSSEPVRVSDLERITNDWTELDPWWDTYAETGHETTVEIAALLDRSNEAWRHSAAPFDTDPLASVVDQDQGPLLPSNEEDWSDWLAKLLRPSPVLVAELLDVSVDQPPENVVREDQLSKEEGGFRRPDILALHLNRAISIEVKIDDTHYAKTAETAELIERDYPSKEWTHTLLLPKRNVGRLRANVTPPVKYRSEDELQIEWDAPGPVSVIHWRDVTAALRTLLQRGEVVDDHWTSNAYLFCAAVEQQLMNFQPQPTIERLARPIDVVDTVQPITLADTLNKQRAYLRARQNL